ncbi:MAG: serine protease [Parcubacteria bacterium C7867-001]|nr:MAG: serine protease [Parcubacteria bacterium C7867-001]
MIFEGSREVLERLHLKQKLLREKDPAHEEIRPALLILSGVMRGVYGGGQTIALHQHGLSNVFDTVVGISTGAPVAAYFVANDIERGLTIYWNECATPEFLSFRRSFGAERPMDIDYLGSVFRGETARGVRLSQEALSRSRSALYTGVTCRRTGEGIFLDAKLAQPDVVQAVQASLAAPWLSHGNVVVDGNSYIDGAGALPFPAQEVIERFRPTDLLVLANCSPELKSSLPRSLLRSILVASLPPSVRDAFATMDTRFQSSLAYLRSQEDCRYAIVWTDDDLTGFEQNPVRLECAAERARKHLSDLLA